MRYHLFKKSRVYSGRPYCGPTSDNEPAEADTLEEAITLQQEMKYRNPVGWDIFDSETQEKVNEI